MCVLFRIATEAGSVEKVGRREESSNVGEIENSVRKG